MISLYVCHFFSSFFIFYFYFYLLINFSLIPFLYFYLFIYLFIFTHFFIIVIPTLLGHSTAINEESSMSEKNILRNSGNSVGNGNRNFRSISSGMFSAGDEVQTQVSYFTYIILLIMIIVINMFF